MDLSGWVGVGIGGNCGCRCGILMLVSWVGFVVLVWEIYKTLLARKLSKPEDGRYRPKHAFFPIANKHHHLAVYS